MAEHQQPIKKTILDNGLTVISEFLPAVRSVSVGAWINVGSRYECAAQNGITHFLEHMVFKATRKRSALKIAQALEDLGGSLNAYTSKELTVFYTHALDSHLSISINVLADLICNPLFRPKDIERERQVILEEINAVKDTPDEYIIDVFQEKLFPDQSLGYPILGKEETVANFNRDQLLDYWKRYYVPGNIVLSAAGNVKHERLVQLAQRYFHFKNEPLNVELQKPKTAEPFDIRMEESVSQAHICAGLEGLSYLTDERYQLIALNSYLGGGMSSRLFQRIREKHGLAYAVYSFVEFFRDTGMISFYIGTDRNNQQRALDLLYKEIRRVTEKKIGKNTVHKIREQLKGNFLLGLESSHRRMTRLAKSEIYYGRQIDLEEIIQKIDAITPESLLVFARSVLATDKFNVIRIAPELS